MDVIKKIFTKLIDKVLKPLKGEDKRKTLAMMLLNDVEKKNIQKLKERVNKTNAVENYLKIVGKYNEKHVNEAKAILRSAVFKMMNADWIFNTALNARFRNNVR